MIYTGKKCKWDDIKVGEVFANKVCWEIHYKIDEDKSLLLGYDWGDDFSCTEYNLCRTKYSEDLYKLPKSVQALWKVD